MFWFVAGSYSGKTKYRRQNFDYESILQRGGSQWGGGSILKGKKPHVFQTDSGFGGILFE